MTWRTGLLVLGVMLVMLWALAVLTALRTHRQEDRDLVDAITPIALPVVMVLFGEPILTERVRARRHRDDDNGHPGRGHDRPA